MKFKALRASITAAVVTVAFVAIVTAAVEQSLTVADQPSDGTLAQAQEGVGARA